MTQIQAAPGRAALLQAIRDLRFGSVEVVVHEGRVVQIEKREKVCIPDSRPPVHRRHQDTNTGWVDRTTGGTALDGEEQERES